MSKSASRLFIAISLLVLISLACNKPILSQSQSNTSDTVTDVSGESDTTSPRNTDGAELTLIPGATFQMGSSTLDPQAEENESPEHEVTLEEFYIYTHEVTNQMYEACVTAGECIGINVQETGTTTHYGSPDDGEYPVVGVDWVMARDYCIWAGSRLPTEAEWELASRGPESLIYPWGEEEPTCDRINMSGCLIPPDTQPVGNYLMGNSPDGVWDMSGNVWEWVHDWYAEDYYSKSPSNNPIGPLEPADPENPLRAIRGGGLNSDPARMRSATRMGLNPYRPFTDVGIRCVVGEGLVLPAAYDHGEDRHDDVPPESADGDDDPDDDSGLRSIRLRAGCVPPDIADFGVIFDPADPALFSASTDFGPLVCDHLPPPDGAYYCHDLPGSFGDTINIDFSFTDGSLMEALVEYPLCLSFWIDHFCDEDDTGANVPHLVLHYAADGPAFDRAAASAAGGLSVDLTCIITVPGTAVCTGIPGVSGNPLGIFVVFDDDSTLLGDYTYPFCGVAGFIPPWDVSLGCVPYPDGTAEYRATINTNMAGLDFIPGSWTLTGIPIVPEPKNCTLDDAAANIWGCNFPIGTYGDMEFCADWVGVPGSHCETFDGSLLPADCSTPPDDDEGGDPVMGFCRPGPIPGSCSGACLPTCPPAVNCNVCTMP